MQIRLTSVMVQDQEKALKFYTEVLGFQKRNDIPAGDARWLTVTANDDPDGIELLLEPVGLPAARTFQSALFEAGIPLTAFFVPDIQEEYQRLKGMGVRFTVEPTSAGEATIAIFDDTCGNLIQIYQV